MAASPKYKVYNGAGQYVASCKEPSDAAVLVLISYTDGGTVRLGHGQTLFTSNTGLRANDLSYDEATQLILEREAAIQQAGYDRAYAMKAEPSAVTR